MATTNINDRVTLRKSSRFSSAACDNRTSSTPSRKRAPAVGRKVASRRIRKTPAVVKALKEKYQWLSEMDADYDHVGDSHSENSESDITLSYDSGSDDENDDSRCSSQIMLAQLQQQEFAECESFHELVLPPSCDDLMLANEFVLRAAGAYETLRRFSLPLRLSPFRFEDFCAAMVLQDTCRLVDETHMALLKAIIRADEAVGTMCTSVDSKDSAAIVIYCGISDPLCWFEFCRLYLNCCPLTASAQSVVEIFESRSCYSDVTVAERIQIIDVLVDLFLATEFARDFLSSPTEFEHESHCRRCNR